MKARILIIITAMLWAGLIISPSANAQVSKKVSKTTKVSAREAIKSQKILNTQVNEAKAPYSVGDYAHGGIVIYVDNTGEHGLVCSKTDQSTSLAWSLSNYTEVGSNGNDIYSGKTNTVAIVNKIGKSQNAAAICNNLVSTENGVTYNDWYLPSKAELDLISQNYAIINSTAKTIDGSVLGASSYWSSTEYDSTKAWTQFCYSGNRNQSRMAKDTKTCVRAVRRF